MGVIIYHFNLNVLPKMSHGVLECDIVILQLHAYDFIIKDFLLKRGVICARPCIIYVCIYYIFISLCHIKYRSG